MQTKKEYALYIHIPFCARKCNYCDFISYAGIEHLIPEYLEALSREINFYAENLKKPQLKTVYFGGGTPSLLDTKEIRHILDHIRAGFKISQSPETTMEVNPGTLNFMKLVKLNKMGINRLSIGAQSFNDELLKTLGRIHSAAEIRNTFQAARYAGFDNVNLDLIFALPNQSVEDWEKTLKEATALRPDHISTYNLIIEEGTPFYEARASLLIPSEEEECQMFELAIDFLTHAGFIHYEISNFAKPGKRCQNNLTYWDNEEYIGVGTGATSYIDGRRYSNTKKVDTYIKLWKDEDMGKNLLQEHKNFKRKIKQEVSDAVFLGLRKLDGIDANEILSRYGLDVFDLYKNEVKDLAERELIQIDNSRIKLSKRGLFLANEVFEKFV